MEEAIIKQGLLSQEEIEEVHKVFVMIDRTGKGLITIEDLCSTVHLISMNPAISRDSLQQLWGHLDVDKDGKVSWEDFLGYTCNWLHKNQVLRARTIERALTIEDKNIIHSSLASMISLEQPGLKYKDVDIIFEETCDLDLESVYNSMVELYVNRGAWNKQALDYDPINTIDTIQHLLRATILFKSNRLRVSDLLENVFTILINENIRSTRLRTR